MSEERVPVLIVAEDDRDMRRLLVCVLERSGYSVLACPDGASLLAALRQLHDSPADLLISDVSMPGLTGLQAIEQAQSEGYTLPFIIMTTMGQDDAVLEKARLQGAMQVFEKPFELGALLESTRNCLGHLEGFTQSSACGETK
ncbi:MAG: response regulator [Planctomycetota bacterium]|nr:response regulator [Planctomycetota bacterium]